MIPMSGKYILVIPTVNAHSKEEGILVGQRPLLNNTLRPLSETLCAHQDKKWYAGAQASAALLMGTPFVYFCGYSKLFTVISWIELSLLRLGGGGADPRLCRWELILWELT